MKFFLLVVMMSSVSFGWFGGCLHKSCNPSLSYAMGKERSVISKRLGELIRSIHSKTSETDKGNKLLLKEILELNRLRQRSVITLQSTFRESFNSKRIRMESSLGVSLKSKIAKEEK